MPCPHYGKPCKWGTFCHDPNQNFALDHFLKIVEKQLDKHAPYKNMKHPKSQFETKPRITPGLAYSIKIDPHKKRKL